MRKKIKTLVYPFDDECEAFLEFHSWMEYIDIIAVDTPCGWGNMNFIEEGNIQQIGSNIKGIEILWIVESTNKITLNEFEKRLIFLTKDIKNILVSRKLSAEEFDKLEEIAKINSVKIIEEKDIIGTLSEQSFEESGEGYALKDIEIPIVMIAGAGENCNKFELELLIANKLKEIGYKVSIVTSRSNGKSPLFLFRKDAGHEHRSFGGIFVKIRAAARFGEAKAPVQGLSGGGDVAGFGHLLEYTIKLQFHRHDAGPHK